MLGFFRKGKTSERLEAVPRTLSAELLAALAGACPLPEASEDERRAFGRICIGTRATLRAAGSDGAPIPVLLRDLCAGGVGVLVNSPVETDKEYWIYIPKLDDPDDVAALCCVMLRCDPGGFDRSAYVAAATFIEGNPPPLEPKPAKATAGSPNQLEEEGHRAPPARRVGGLFLPTPDPAAAPPEPTTPDPAASDQQTPPAPQPVVAPQPFASPPPETVPAPACQEAPPQPPSQPSAAPPICVEPSLQIPQSAESPKREESEPVELTPEQIRRIAETIKPHLAYLKRLMNRMDHHQASPDASLRQDLDKANQAVEQFHRHLQALAAPASQAPGPKPDKRAAQQPNKGYQAKGHQSKSDEIQCLIQLRQALLPSIN